MAAVSTIGATTKRAIIPFIPTVATSDIPTVTLHWTVNDKKRRAIVPFVSDEDNPELILRWERDFRETFPWNDY